MTRRNFFYKIALLINNFFFNSFVEKTEETELTNEGSYIDYILDITIAYPQGEPLDLPNIVTGLRKPFSTYFLYRLYHTSQVNTKIELRINLYI